MNELHQVWQNTRNAIKLVTDDLDIKSKATNY